MVKSNPHREGDLDSTLSKAKISLYAQQGKGIRIVPLHSTSHDIVKSEDKADPNNICLRDLISGECEIWAEDGTVNSHINLTESILRPWRMQAKQHVYSHLLKQSDCCALSTHHVTLNYFCTKCKVLTKENAALEAQVEAMLQNTNMRGITCSRIYPYWIASVMSYTLSLLLNFTTLLITSMSTSFKSQCQNSIHSLHLCYPPMMLLPSSQNLGPHSLSSRVYSFYCSIFPELSERPTKWCTTLVIS